VAASAKLEHEVQRGHESCACGCRVSKQRADDAQEEQEKHDGGLDYAILVRVGWGLRLV